MIDSGLLDDLVDRVDEGGLALIGEGGFLPEMIKAGAPNRGLARRAAPDAQPEPGAEWQIVRRHSRSSGGNRPPTA